MLLRQKRNHFHRINMKIRMVLCLRFCCEFIYRTRAIISRGLYFFFTQFSLWLRLMLQTSYVLKTEILQFLSLKSAAYKQERLQIESGLWWRAYGKQRLSNTKQRLWNLKKWETSPSFTVLLIKRNECMYSEVSNKRAAHLFISQVRL